MPSVPRDDAIRTFILAFAVILLGYTAAITLASVPILVLAVLASTAWIARLWHIL